MGYGIREFGNDNNQNNYIMQSETLFSLVGKIRVQRIRLSQTASHTLAAPWNSQEELKFFELVDLYGADFALIQAYFPARSRKQIRRKFLELEQRCGRQLQRSEGRRLESKRKDYFDEEILANSMIIWPKKPNIAESSSSEESL